MQQIFCKEHLSVGDTYVVTGEDARHLGAVVRLSVHEIVRLSCENSDSFLCEVMESTKENIVLRLIEPSDTTELPSRISLFQAIPKGDRMETVIEKAVELGVYEIIPVQMRYCVVKLDEKKKISRQRRYQAIAETAAKQSKRSFVPQVHPIVDFSEALSMAKEKDFFLLPYEAKDGMADTKEALSLCKGDSSIAVMIGPEGGFAPEEIDVAKEDAHIISLGRRILRTDTAAITTMSMLMLALEMKGNEHGMLS